jgi:chaperonin GroES
MSALKPLHENVVVEREAAEARSAGGIVIPDSAKEKPVRGTVLAVGPGRVLPNGEVKALDVKKGDKILFGGYAGSEIKLDGKDYLIVNEIEAGECSGIAIRRSDGSFDRDALAEAARKLHRNNLVVVHLPEGAFALGPEGEIWVPSKPLKTIVSSVGAGDAFAAGLLYGLHEEWPLQQCLDLGHLAAAACMGHETTTGGLRPVSEL